MATVALRCRSLMREYLKDDDPEGSSRLFNTQLMPADVSLDPGDGLTSKIGTEASSLHVTSLAYMPARSRFIFRAALGDNDHDQQQQQQQRHQHHRDNHHHHIAMTQLTTEDLKESPGLYDSPRGVGDVLAGEDAAHLLIEASSSGNDTALQSLLSQPQWIKTILEEPHTIYSEDRPSQGPNDARRVMAMRTSNLERALNAAAGNGQAAVVSTLLTFATQQGMAASDVITRLTINKTINGGHGTAFKALASADPNVINFPYLGHGTLPLYEAVRRRKPDVVAVLLELGADPLHPVAPSKRIWNFHSSLLSFAAMCEGPRMTEMLLEHGLPIADTGALHTAARWGHLDTMRLLMEHGADLDEVLPNFFHWTPMHFAASKSEVDAMKLLEHSGARSDLKDKNGKTPAQLLEERNAAIAREGGEGQGTFWPWNT